MWRWFLGCWLLAGSVSAQDGAIEANAVEPSNEASSEATSDESPNTPANAGSDATVPSAADPADSVVPSAADPAGAVDPASDTASDGSTSIAASTVGNDANTTPSASESPSDASNDGDVAHPGCGTGPSDAHANGASPLRQRFVFLRPGWMPHVTVGYRSHTIRFGSDREKESSRGITSGAVFPIVASGGDSSRVRFALAAGLGIDFAHYRHRVTDPFVAGEQPLVRGYVQRTRYFYGQVGGLLRVSFGRNALVASLLWLPGRRKRSTKPYEDYERPFPGDADDAMLARGRFSFALVRSHVHVGFFVGLGHASLPDERGVEVEYALQLGTGW